MNIKQNLVNENKYNIKCPYEMDAEFIVVHNTANDASAQNEIAYMIRNDNKVSFHYAIDDQEIVQGIPENRNSWNAGDGGNGQGNRKGIAIEICYSKSGGDKFNNAEKLASEFIAMKLKEKGWGIDRVKKHQDFSNKYCPHRTLDMGWDRFLDMIKAHMEVPTETAEPQTTKSIDELANEVIAGKYGNGEARKQALGSMYNEVQTRVNEILAGNKVEKPVVDNSIKVGDKVRVKQGARSYKGVSLASFVYNNTYEVMELNGDRAVIGKNGAVTTDIHINNLYK